MEEVNSNEQRLFTEQTDIQVHGLGRLPRAPDPGRVFRTSRGSGRRRRPAGVVGRAHPPKRGFPSRVPQDPPSTAGSSAPAPLRGLGSGAGFLRGAAAPCWGTLAGPFCGSCLARTLRAGVWQGDISHKLDS